MSRTGSARRSGMGFLRSIESGIEYVVDGTVGRVVRVSVQPVEIARKLAKELEDGKVEAGGRTLVPSQYTVYLPPKDRERFAEYEASLRVELGAYLAEHVRREGYSVRARPRVTFETAEELSSGTFGIATEPETPAEPERRSLRVEPAPVDVAPELPLFEPESAPESPPEACRRHCRTCSPPLVSTPTRSSDPPTTSRSRATPRPSTARPRSRAARRRRRSRTSARRPTRAPNPRRRCPRRASPALRGRLRRHRSSLCRRPHRPRRRCRRPSFRGRSRARPRTRSGLAGAERGHAERQRRRGGARGPGAHGRCAPRGRPAVCALRARHGHRPQLGMRRPAR